MALEEEPFPSKERLFAWRAAVLDLASEEAESAAAAGTPP
jgi:hypothetical protein